MMRLKGGRKELIQQCVLVVHTYLLIYMRAKFFNGIFITTKVLFIYIFV